MGERKVLYGKYSINKKFIYLYFLFITQIKVMEKQNSLSIIQPNRITNARYNFSAIEKNIIYCILEAMQKEMSYQQLLFDRSRKYTIDISKFMTSDNYNYVLKEAEKLVKKTIWYDWKNDKGKINDTVTAIISSATKERGTGFLTLEVPEMALPVLLYIGQGVGGTILQKTIALSLKSKHSKRLYELCSRWKDKGGFNMSLDEFKKMLYVEKKYTKVSMLQKFVLDAAKKELKESADVWFEYDLKKIKSRSFNWIYFSVFQNDPKLKNAEKGLYPPVYNFLLISFPSMFNDSAMHITDQLSDKGQLSNAWAKFRPIYEKYVNNEMEAKHLVNTTRKILREDFGIKN
jgi:plasmid replication initiation protein